MTYIFRKKALGEAMVVLYEETLEESFPSQTPRGHRHKAKRCY